MSENPLSSDWRLKAKCANEDPELFISSSPGDISAAKAICQLCVVRVDCLEWAVTTGESTGTWGGTSEKELRNIARGRAITT